MTDMIYEPNGDEENAQPKKEGPGARGWSRGVVALLLIALATTFAVQNNESVDVTFLTWDFSMSKILLMLGSALVGILLWGLVSAIRRRRQ